MPIINVENESIKTASVEIKTLTVSGKQVTLSVFRQIIEENILDEDNFKLNGTPWATVNYFWKDDQHCQDLKLHVLWQKGSELRRCIILKKSYNKDKGLNTEKYNKTQSQIYNTRSYLRDIQDNDHHYISEADVDKCSYVKPLKRMVSNTMQSIQNIKEGRCSKGKDVYGHDLEYYENLLIKSQKRLDFILNELKNEVSQLNKTCEYLSKYEIEYNKLVEPLIDLPHLFIAI